MSYLMFFKYLLLWAVGMELMTGYFMISAMFMEYKKKGIKFYKIIIACIILIAIMLGTLAIRQSL